MRITSAGDVGIGSNAPDYKVHIYSDNDTGETLRVENSNSGTAASSAIVIESNSNALALSCYSSTKSGTYAGQPLADMNRLYSDNARRPDSVRAGCMTKLLMIVPPRPRITSRMIVTQNDLKALVCDSSCAHSLPRSISISANAPPEIIAQASNEIYKP